MLNNKYLQLLLAILALIVSARIAFDLPLSRTNIPITGQTLGVILVAYFLPKYWGSLAVFIYLILGFIGLPVLADGAGGIDKFTGGSAGFLFGFLAAALAISKLTETNRKTILAEGLIVNIIGTLIILIFGNSWLIYKYGMSDGLAYGFLPFWKGALVKILLGVLIIYIWQNWFGKKKITA